MKVKLDCPYGRYDSEMRIICGKDNEPCGWQYFRSCMGWWALSEGAATCVRRTEGNGTEAGKGRENRV